MNPDEQKASISSHVTQAPDNMPGENYDPKIRVQYANEPSVVHATRAIDQQPFKISAEVQKLHEESVKKYPNLSLSSGEYVILEIRRHPIGLASSLIGGAIVFIVLTAVLILYPLNAAQLSLPSFGIATFIAGLLMALTALGTLVAVWVYSQNRFILTNESVIQDIQMSLFSHREQLVSLGSIEDASYRENGILQTLLDYGSIRLSTEGDETTYQFSYVASPKQQVATVNNAIEAFKNGRPYELNEDLNIRY